MSENYVTMVSFVLCQIFFSHDLFEPENIMLPSQASTNVRVRDPVHKYLMAIQVSEYKCGDIKNVTGPHSSYE